MIQANQVLIFNLDTMSNIRSLKSYYLAQRFINIQKGSPSIEISPMAGCSKQKSTDYVTNNCRYTFAALRIYTQQRSIFNLQRSNCCAQKAVITKPIRKYRFNSKHLRQPVSSLVNCITITLISRQLMAINCHDLPPCHRNKSP